jgi:hypothetical protein
VRYEFPCTIPHLHVPITFSDDIKPNKISFALSDDVKPNEIPFAFANDVKPD